MIPNVLPFVFVLGFMGAVGWNLDYFRMMLASVLEILSSFGVLLCGSVLVAWIIELLLTPTLMVLFKPFRPEFVPTAQSKGLAREAID